MKKFILFISIFLCASNLMAQDLGNGFTRKVNFDVIVTDTSSFEHVVHFMRVDKTYCSGMHTLEAIFPYMQTNHYQVVKNAKVFTGGEVRDNAEGGNKYIGYSLHSAELQQLPNVFDVGMSFDVATININVNFDAIKTIYPYDTTSREYIENTGDLTECIQPHHPHIDSVANVIWAQSSDIIDYARRCYEYTASYLKYLDDNTGIHSIQSIIDKGGGDCGNFSSYYISLLRNRDIPARHVVCVMEQDNYHVWAEFYLQNYGWIPVDPTWKNGDRQGDYFGHKNNSYYNTTLGIELTDYRFAADSEPMQLVLMQLLYYGWWAYDPCTSYDFNFMIQRSPIEDSGDTSVRTLAEEGVSVYTRGNRIIVRGAEKQQVQAFDLSGRLIGNGNNGIIVVPKNGVYLVKVGSHAARKVVVVRGY